MLKIRSLAAVALVAFATSPLCAQIIVPAAPTVPGGRPAKPAVKDGVKDAAQAGKNKEAEHTIDPKAKALYEKALAAVKAAKSVEFTGQMTMGGDDPAMQVMMPPELTAKTRFSVRFAEPKPGEAAPKVGMGLPPLPRDSIRAERVDGPGKGTVLVIHGGKVLQFDPAKKTYNEGGAQPELVAMMGIGPFPDVLRRSGLGFEGGEIVSIEFAGTTVIDDLECDVVKLVQQVEVPTGAMPNDGFDDAEAGAPAKTGGGMKMTLHQKFAIARADGLPRQQTTKPKFADMPEDIEAGLEDGSMALPAPEMIFTVSGLKVDPKIDDAAFALKAPEGFTKAEPEMPGMMVPGDAGEAPQPPALAVKVGDAAPDFKLTTLDGKEVTLASLKGKVVLLDFWATWCGPCKAAMPTIQKISEDYKGKDVVVLGVNTWEQKADAAKEYIAKKKYTYGCLLKGDELAKAYGVTGIPTLVIIGKDGKVASTEVGMSDESGAMIRKAIDAALAQ